MKGRLISGIAAILMLGSGLMAQALSPLPVQEYDYHITDNVPSPITLGMGGLNLTNAADYFTSYDNPALLADNTGTSFAASYRLANEDEIGFADVVSVSNLLKSKQFMYYTLITKNSAWSYQPVASTHISTLSATTAEYYDFQLDKLQISLAASDEKYARLSGGINIKYLTGRLVYLRERINYSNMIREAFIDNKVKGVSGDLGFTWKEDKFTLGASLYDVLSRLWWEDYGSKKLARRAGMGIQYNGESYALTAGLQGKLASDAQTTYHFGYVKNWNWKSSTRSKRDINQNLVLRAGLFSKNFNGTDNINYTLGSGYNYNMFRMDFALTNTGMQLRDSKYLFSVGVGIQ